MSASGGMTTGARKADVTLYDVVGVYALDNVYGSNGRLLSVIAEQAGEEGEVTVTLTERWGEVHAGLTVGADVALALVLRANENLSNRGVQLFSAGFIVTPGEAAQFLPLPAREGGERAIRRKQSSATTATAAI